MDMKLKSILLPDRLTCQQCKLTLRKKAPYCLAEVKNGKLILLDRDYKPLGSDGRWADYDDPRWSEHLFDPSDLNLGAAGLTKQESQGNERAYFFYNDGNKPYSGKKDDRERFTRLLEDVFPREALDRVAHLAATVAWT